ncbi:MAG: hypothetical protein U9N59_12860 [Campylobacterota bacterium]|nr:hypothetical protein [Campylobacterota bacterium]
MPNNKYTALLNEHQLQNVTKQRKKFTAKYFAMYCDLGHLDRYMITLSPISNTIQDTLNLRKHFFRKLSNKKTNLKKKNIIRKVGYFSAIEIGLNKNVNLLQDNKQQNNLIMFNLNYHIHIQLLTDMTEKELRSVLGTLDKQQHCWESELTPPRTIAENKKTYQYAIKDLIKTDWKLQYFNKTYFPSKALYTSSRGDIPNFIITKLWYFMKQTFKDDWNKIKDKYTFVFNSRQSQDIVFNIVDKKPNTKYKFLQVSNSKKSITYDIYIKKDIL